MPYPAHHDFLKWGTSDCSQEPSLRMNHNKFVCMKWKKFSPRQTTLQMRRMMNSIYFILIVVAGKHFLTSKWLSGWKKLIHAFHFYNLVSHRHRTVSLTHSFSCQKGLCNSVTWFVRSTQIINVFFLQIRARNGFRMRRQSMQWISTRVSVCQSVGPSVGRSRFSQNQMKSIFSIKSSCENCSRRHHGSSL